MSSSLSESAWFRVAIAWRLCWSRLITAAMMTENVTTTTMRRTTKKIESPSVRLRARACSASMYSWNALRTGKSFIPFACSKIRSAVVPPSRPAALFPGSPAAA